MRAAKHRLDGIEYAIKRSANEITDKALKAQWIQVGASVGWLYLADVAMPAICHYARCAVGCCQLWCSQASCRCSCVQEIHAWARLSGHPHVVRYYSSWFEKGGRGEHAFIQLEK